MPPFYKRLHRKKDGRELFLYGLMPLEGPPLPEHAEPFRPL
ncbi:galactose-1-phosphate uridylyltransferase, partial [Thermus scotoductus]